MLCEPYFRSKVNVVFSVVYDEQKINAPGEGRISINISQSQSNAWFITNKGKEYSPKEKSLDTKKHNVSRLKWARDNHYKIRNLFVHVVYLNKKWFYTTSWRRKIKQLPLGSHETQGVDIVV